MLHNRLKKCFVIAFEGLTEWKDNLLLNIFPIWLKPVFRLKTRFDDSYLSLVAAGVGFYFFLAAFPALGAAIALYGLFSDPAYISEHISLFAHILPPSVLDIINKQARDIALSGEHILGAGFFISMILAIYSAAKGVSALIQGMNIVHGLPETRNYFILSFISVTLTFIILMYAMISLTVIALMPAVLKFLFLPTFIIDVLLWSRWPLLFLSSIIGLEFLYYFGPNRERPRWRLVSWGSFAATLLWLLFSTGFSIFVLNFGHYNETYGSLGAIAILLLWLWLSALTILIGAQVNVLAAEKSNPQE